MSVREVDREQARIFQLRRNKELKERKGMYWIRSVTGYRYTLVIDTKDARREYPFSELVVIGCVMQITAEVPS